MKSIDKCVEMMIGFATGDTYGSGYENLSRTQVHERLIEGNYQKNPLYPDHLPKKYTDDTQMHVAVTKTLFSPETFTAENLADRFVQEYLQDPRPIYSKRTLRALHGARNGEEFLQRLNTQSTSNGSVMRSVPLGVCPEKDLEELAAINSKTTHNTPQAIDASTTIAYASHYFFHELGPASEVCDYIIEHMKHRKGESLNHLQHIATLAGYDAKIIYGKEHANFGVPQDAIKTMGAALHILQQYGEQPRQVLKESILLGGDTDTVAAIALGISASRYGLEEMSENLIAELDDGPFGKHYLKEMGIRLATTQAMEIETVPRLNYPGTRQTMVTNYADGLIEALEPAYLHQLGINLTAQLENHDKITHVIGMDASGYIMATIIAQELKVPLISTKKAELDRKNKIRFKEPSTAHPDIFLYALPKEPSTVVIVDDEMQTGATVSNLIDAMQESPHNIGGVIVPVEALDFNAREKIEQKGVPVISHTKYWRETT